MRKIQDIQEKELKMALEWTLFSIPLLIAGIMSLFIAIFALQYRPNPSAIIFSMMAFITAEWSFAYMMEILSASLSDKIFFFDLKMIGTVILPPLWLVFTIEYTGKENLTIPSLLVLSIEPIFTLVLAWTNDALSHELVRSGTRLAMDTPYKALVFDFGIWFWVNSIFGGFLLLLGTFLLILRFQNTPGIFRGQIIALLIAMLLPIVGNIISLLVMQPINPLFFAFSNLLFFWGIFHYQLIKIMPVAQDAIVRNMTDGVIVLDNTKRIVHINPAAKEMVSFTHRSSIGQPIETIFPSWLNILSPSIKTEQIHKEISLGEGSEKRHYSLRISPLISHRKALKGSLITIHDNTDYKEAQNALHQRTLELEATNEELNTFGHTVAHDLKDPVLTIIGYANLIEELDLSNPDEDFQSYAKTITRVAFEMNHLIEELMLLSGLRHKKVIKEPVRDMAKIIREVQKRLEWLIKGSQAEIILPEIWPVVLGYRPWIVELWANYISNAIKYGGQSPHVVLGHDTIQDEGMVRFWVHDNGSGLSSIEQSRLFTPFTHLNNVHATGHGLGLSIVQRIIEKLGGQVGLESDVGQGSIFFFTLPIADRV